VIISILEEMYLSAQKFLRDFATSVWTMRGVSYFHHNNNNMVHVDEIFDLLVPNLRQTNHYLRLYTLSILSSSPTKSYVVDHADIDFTQDLDEEPSNVNQSNASMQSNSVFYGTCDLTSILYRIEKLPLHIDQERKLTSYISRVEVLGRSGKLPVVYAEAAANHMLGILSLKFSPVWPAATKAFAGVVLSSSSSTALAEQLLDSLISKIESISFLGPTILASSTKMSAMPCPLLNFADFYQEIGLDSSLFKVKQLTILAQTVAVEDVAKIRYQKQVGFLNLISDAISYLGYGIHAYTDIFLPILLSICEHSETLGVCTTLL